MRNAVRTQAQVEKTQDEISERTGLIIEDEHLTRQELAQETDTQEILSRMGVGQGLTMRTPVYGDYDTDIDLQRALHIARDAREAWENLPPEIHDKYRNWHEYLNAAERGELGTESDTNKGKADAVEASNKQNVPGGNAASSSDDKP